MHMRAGTIKGLLRIIPRSLKDVGCHRSNLFGITFEPDGLAVATNGHMLLAFKTGLEFEGAPFIIQADVLRTAIKGQKAKFAIDLNQLKPAFDPIAAINWRLVTPAEYSGSTGGYQLNPVYLLAVRDALNDILQTEELVSKHAPIAILSPVPNDKNPWLAFANARALAIIMPLQPEDTAKAMIEHAAKFLPQRDSEG